MGRDNQTRLELFLTRLLGFVFLAFLPGRSLALLPTPLDVPAQIESLLFLGTLREPSVLRPELVSASHAKAWLWIDRNSGAHRLIEFKDPPFLPGFKIGSNIRDTSKAVLDFLDDNFELLQISSENLSLKLESSLLIGEHQFLKYDVYFNDILIKDGNIDVRLFQGRVLQIINESYREAQVAAPLYTEKDAKRVMKASLKAPFAPLSTYYRVSLKSDGYHLVPTHLLKTFPSSNTSFDIEFDLKSGQLTEVSADRFSANIPVGIKGFGIDPKAGLFTLPYSLGQLKSAPSGQVQFTSASGEIAKGTYQFDGLSSDVAMIMSSDDEMKLNAFTVKDRDSEGKAFLTFPAHSKDTEPQNDIFYAHGTVFRTLTLLKRIAGEIDGKLSSWIDGPIKAYVNEDSECNAYYIRRDTKGPKSGSLNFLQGKKVCNNTGNMADVVAHEWGHGLDDATGGIEDRAFSEGFGDTVAYAVFFKPEIGTDLTRDGKPIRDISEFKSYPNDRGESHQEGLIIANTFYDLYQNLLKSESEDQAKKLFRTYIFQMIKGARKYTDVHDFLMAFERDLNRRCLINKVFKSHGLGRVREECS